MAKIIVNNNKEINGLLTVIRKRDDEGNIIVSGQLLTHRYIDHIYHIESERYILDNVDIVCEEFASNDAMIRYEFFTESLFIKGLDDSNDNETNLPQHILTLVEQEYFKDEQKELIHKEVYMNYGNKR